MADEIQKVSDNANKKKNVSKRRKIILTVGASSILACLLVVLAVLVITFFVQGGKFHSIYRLKSYYTDFSVGYDNPELGWAVDFRDNNADPDVLEQDGYMEFKSGGSLPGSRIKNGGFTIWTRIPTQEEIDATYGEQGKMFIINRNSAIGFVLNNCSVEAFVDFNENGVQDTLEEEFTDLNDNGIWDVGEPYIDSNSNGICDADETRVSSHYEQIVGPKYDTQYLGNYLEYINLDERCGGHTIYITFHTNSRYSVNIQNIQIGTASSIYYNYYRTALITFTVSMAFGIFIVILAIFSMAIKGSRTFKPQLIAAAVFETFLAVYLAIKSGYLQIMTHCIFSWTAISYLALIISSSCLAIYLYLLSANQVFKTISRGLMFYCIFFVIALSVSVLIPGSMDMSLIMPFIYLGFLATLTSLFVNQIVKYKKGEIELWFVINTASLLVASAASTFVRYLGYAPGVMIILNSLMLIDLAINITLEYKREVIDSNQEVQQSTKEQEMKSKIMLAQIQPHFLYNSLNSIAILCDIDPRQARDLTVKFSKYLRNNINSLSEESAVKFTQELDNIRNYLEIEKIRFPNKLKIVEDIKVSEFLVPILSIQPLVENAVKHGISKKPTPSVLYISTYDDENNYYVQIKDNGVGFDVSILDEKKKSGSIGIDNVKYRLKSISNGNVNIESAIGVGTTVLVTLPKKDNKRQY